MPLIPGSALVRAINRLTKRSLYSCYALAILCVAAAEGPSSPAETKIAAAQKAIAEGKATWQAYNDLAMALARRARETADPNFYSQANQAVEECVRRASDDLECLKTRVWILLGQHEFAKALEEAQALNKRNPDDLMVYAMLVDAHAELGNYTEAETAAQWLLDLRPGTIPGLTRAAYLRELFGDLEGALDFMVQAYQRTPPSETEDRAWLLTHIAHLQRISARPDEAEKTLAEALRLFPDYHYALAELARVRTAQKKFPEAVGLMKKRYDAAPHPENLYDLAEAHDKAGQGREARKLYKQFEKGALKESSGVDNANRELILYYCDKGRNASEALRLAELEMKRRPNLYMRDAYAWALFKNKRTAQAKSEIEKVLAVGTRDPAIHEHARAIDAFNKKPFSNNRY